MNMFQKPMPRTIKLGLTSLDRKAIEDQIEELVSLLDAIDGDPDIEDDELHDDPLDLGESTKDVGPPLRYGIDQSKGYIGFKRSVNDSIDRQRGDAAAETERLGFLW